MRFPFCSRYTFMLPFMMTMTGCSLLQAASHTDKTAQYAESVFRHQNTVISQIMQLIDEGLMPDDSRLTEAEQQMHQACHLLNEYAERDSEGQSITLGFKKQVLESVKACDNRIEHLELLLSILEKNITLEHHGHE